MGAELRRMIRDGAPDPWTPLMRFVAEEIADDARDPSQGPAEDGGLPWSALSIAGHFDRRGRWRDGLTERCGMSARAVSRVLTDLARAGYEMREQIGTDRTGRPVFAAKGHALRFRVPPLPSRPKPQSTPDSASYEGQSTPNSACKHAEFGDPISPSPPKELSPQVPPSARSRRGGTAQARTADTADNADPLDAIYDELDADWDERRKGDAMVSNGAHPNTIRNTIRADRRDDAAAAEAWRLANPSTTGDGSDPWAEAPF